MAKCFTRERASCLQIYCSNSNMYICINDFPDGAAKRVSCARHPPNGTTASVIILHISPPLVHFAKLIYNWFLQQKQSGSMNEKVAWKMISANERKVYMCVLLVHAAPLWFSLCENAKIHHREWKTVPVHCFCRFQSQKAAAARHFVPLIVEQNEFI